MNATQRKRLLKLADFIVEQVPDEKFDMGVFGLEGKLTLEGSVLECGSSACALGWSTVFFKKLGVKMGLFGPEYKNRAGYGVGVALFGLTDDQSETLFGGDSANFYKSAKQVRRDILRLVAKLDKEAKLR